MHYRYLAHHSQPLYIWGRCYTGLLRYPKLLEYVNNFILIPDHDNLVSYESLLVCPYE